jgi:hypothetical protein
MKRYIHYIILMLFCFSLTGCSWVGESAGKIQAKMERKGNALEQGYEEGYEKEKTKNP